MLKTLYRRSILTVAFVSMLGVVVLTSLQVVARYVFHASLFWPEELARSLLIILTFLLAGEAYQRGELISATFFRNLFGPTVAKLFDLAALLFSGLLMLALVYFGIQYADMNSAQVLAALQVPVGWVYYAMPLGCLILFGHLLVTFVSRVRTFSRKEGAADASVRQ